VKLSAYPSRNLLLSLLSLLSLTAEILTAESVDGTRDSPGPRDRHVPSDGCIAYR